MRSIPFLLLLSGCWYLDEDRYRDKVQDVDGDGAIAERFGGPDCVDDDPTIADCDADGDGYRSMAVGGNDCDDTRADVYPVPWYDDEDGDGHGIGTDADTGCGEPPAGKSTLGDDCDDTNPAIAPGAEERCDGIDRNCDDDPYRGAVDADVDTWPDSDGDGWGDAQAPATKACVAAEGWVTLGGDCDDDDPDVSPGADEIPYDGIDQDCDPANEFDLDLDGFDVDVDCDDTNADVYPSDGSNPGAPEICDGLDNDCDGLIDDEEDDDDQAPFGQLTWYVDADGDGFGGPTTSRWCPEVDPGPGFTLSADDCNDGNEAVFPGAVEMCNGLDDDCNGSTDEGTAVDAFTAFVDADGDGFGSQPFSACSLSADVDGDGDDELLSFVDGDCYDQFADAYPGAPEICGDGIRQDCSGAPVDDCDADGAPDADDCAIEDPAIFPGAPELCDGVDNDCDDQIDDDDPDVEDATAVVWYADTDGDGFGEAIAASGVCSPPPGGTRNDGDCDDAQASVYPGAPELCDGRDNDCDGALDEGVTQAPRFYFDGDGDGSGDPGTFVNACSPPTPSWVPNGSDCDDRDGANGPLLPELCEDGQDNDCDGLVDDDDPDAELVDGTLFYVDGDGDGFGTGLGLSFCSNPDPSQYTTVPGDCDDTNPDDTVMGTWFEDRDLDGHAGTLAVVFGCQPDVGQWYPLADDCLDSAPDVYPGAPELCNLRDDDCDGTLDNNPDPSDPAAFFGWPDLDNDGDGDESAAQVATCFDGFGVASTNTDCDDDDPARSGLLVEVCDGLMVDEDCDGILDNATIWYLDDDGDGYGDAQDPGLASCTDPGPGYVPNSDDCDDSAFGNSPAAFEICGDGIDNNCDMVADEDCGPPPVTGDCVGWQWLDGDSDGYGDRSARPIFDCEPIPTYVTTAGDCDDNNGSAVPTETPITPASVGALVGLASGCHLVKAEGGTYALNGFAPSGSVQLTLMADDPADPPVFEGPSSGTTGPFAISSSSDMLLHGITIRGGGGTYWLLQMTSASADVTLVETLLDGQDTAAGIRVTHGQLALFDAKAEHLTSAAAGVALQGGKNAEFLIDGYFVSAASGPIASVDIERDDAGFNTPFVADRIHVVGSPGIRLTEVGMAFNGLYVELSGLDLREVEGDGILFSSYYTDATISRSVIVGATGSGIHLEPGMGNSLDLARSTILASGSYGVLMESSSGNYADIDASIIIDSGIGDILSNTGGYSGSGTVQRCNVGSSDITPTNNAGAVTFIGYHPDLAGAVADVHLRFPVTVNGDDVGAYPRDAWYDDDDLDGLFDGWEKQYGVLDELTTSEAHDGDMLNIAEEFASGTSPLLTDTDGDFTADDADIAPLDPNY